MKVNNIFTVPVFDGGILSKEIFKNMEFWKQCKGTGHIRGGDVVWRVDEKFCTLWSL